MRCCALGGGQAHGVCALLLGSGRAIHSRHRQGTGAQGRAASQHARLPKIELGSLSPTARGLRRLNSARLGAEVEPCCKCPSKIPRAGRRRNAQGGSREGGPASSARLVGGDVCSLGCAGSGSTPRFLLQGEVIWAWNNQHKIQIRHHRNLNSRLVPQPGEPIRDNERVCSGRNVVRLGSMCAAAKIRCAY